MSYLQLKTSEVMFLIGCSSGALPLRFPSNQYFQFGLGMNVDGIRAVEEQIRDTATHYLGLANHYKNQIEVFHGFSEVFSDPGTGRELTLLAGRLEIPHTAYRLEWPTFPEILRQSGPGRGRLPFLRAWQVFAGGLEADQQVRAEEWSFDDLSK